MDARARQELIEGLCAFEGRGPGTDAERRAAGWLRKCLRDLGRRAEIEPTYVHPQWSLVIALHCVLAIAGGLLAREFGPGGFALVLFSATSLYLDQNTRLYILRSLFFRRASQNVVSPGDRPDAPARLVLSAHYDAARTGWIFGPRTDRAARRLPEWARVPLGPIRLIFWAGMVPLLIISALHAAGIEAGALDVVQLFPTLLLLISTFLAVDIALSDLVPGAYDNASGVATVLAVAQRLASDPPENLDVWVVLPGAEECNTEGMARWVRAHRKELDRANTYFVNVDSTSFGNVHYLAGEGAVLNHPTDRRLYELCEAVADATDANARPVRIPLHTDALPLLARGFRAISLIGATDGVGAPYYHTPEDTPDRVDHRSLNSAIDFTVALARAIDRDVTRAADRDSAATPEPAPV